MFSSTLLLSCLASTAFSLPLLTTTTVPRPEETDPLNLNATLSKRGNTVRQATNFPFADPSVFRYGPSEWWAFATNFGNVHVQVARSPDFNSWTLQPYDALPTPPAWANQASPGIWAPNVVFNDQKQYVLYYSAAPASDPSKHCIGTATSSTISGPYHPAPQPFVCPRSQGGAIDASGFSNNGNRYVVYKVDGNSIGHGGECGNMVNPIVPTPIMLQRVAGDGVTHIGAPVQILDRDSRDGPLVEAPALMKSADGRYILFFSSGCYTDPSYDVSYAIANNIAGPYTKYGPFAVTGTDGLTSPGGAHVAFDGQHIVFHAGKVGARMMYTAEVALGHGSNSVSGA